MPLPTVLPSLSAFWATWCYSLWPCMMWCATSLGIWECNKLHFQWQSSPDLLAQPYLNNSKTYIKASWPYVHLFSLAQCLAQLGLNESNLTSSFKWDFASKVFPAVCMPCSHILFLTAQDSFTSQPHIEWDRLSFKETQTADVWVKVNYMNWQGIFFSN